MSKGKLFLIGLGLGDEKDITLKGLEAIKECDYLYLEAYTSILAVKPERLEQLYNKKVIVADRELVESKCDDEILEKAKTKKVGFLVVGDPFGATTHADILVRARKMGIEVSSIHNASIMNAVGVCGLQLYRYGQTVSLCFWTENWKPDSYYDKIKENRSLGLHTLCLLDIKVKEISEENLMKGKQIYDPPRFMTINEACKQLLEIEEKRKEKAYDKNTMCVGLARIGTETQQIVAGSMEDLCSIDFGKPLHSLVICGKMHFMEEETLEFYMLDKYKKKKEEIDISKIKLK